MSSRASPVTLLDVVQLRSKSAFKVNISKFDGYLKDGFHWLAFTLNDVSDNERVKLVATYVLIWEGDFVKIVVLSTDHWEVVFGKKRKKKRPISLSKSNHTHLLGTLVKQILCVQFYFAYRVISQVSRKCFAGVPIVQQMVIAFSQDQTIILQRGILFIKNFISSYNAIYKARASDYTSLLITKYTIGSVSILVRLRSSYYHKSLNNARWHMQHRGDEYVPIASLLSTLLVLLSSGRPRFITFFFPV